jgi:hypothetical protein
MGPRERSDSGTFVETVSLEDVLGVFDAVRGPVITSSDVADQLDCTTEAARQKLTRLYDQGKVDKRKTGRTVVWWHTGGERITPSERTGVQQGGSETSPDRGEPVDPVPAEDADETPESLDEAIAAVDTPGSGQNLERREQALREAYEYLKEHGEAQRKDFEDLLGDDVGYSGGFRSWWTNYVKAKDALKQLPNVEAPGEGEHTWHYAGEDLKTDSGVYDPTEEF